MHRQHHWVTLLAIGLVGCSAVRQSKPEIIDIGENNCSRPAPIVGPVSAEHKALDDEEKEGIKKFIEDVRIPPGRAMSIGRFGVWEDDQLGYEIKEFVRCAAHVNKMEQQRNPGTTPQVDYRIVKLNYFLISQPAGHMTFDEKSSIPELTTTERYTLQEFIGMPPAARGDSLSIIKVKLKARQRDEIAKVIGALVGRNGILHVADCHPRLFGNWPRRCTAFEVFKK